MKPPLRIVVVDDDHNSCEGLAELLGDEGYAVVAYKTAARALAALELASYDVLLTDLVMPEMSGFELVRAARSAYPELRCIVMSGRAQSEEPNIEWISKPIDFDLLLAALAR